MSRIGAGGMGEVWKGEDTRLGRIVAIKILPAAVASDIEAIARMRREARTAAQLSHPNIAMIHAFEETDAHTFIAMEYVDGEPLTQLIRRGPLDEAEVCRIGKSVAEALSEAHAKGIVHRDVKPDNIMVNGSRVKVLDFGIAKQVEQDSIRADEATAFMTKAGFILGTVHYMSPEQALGKPLDARSDIFSLGVVLYQAATGKLPFHGESVTETITQIVRDEARVPAEVSRELAGIIRRCMSKNREERYPSATDLANALEHRVGGASTVLTGSRLVTVKEEARRSHPRWPWVAAMLVMLAAVGTGVWIARSPDASGSSAPVSATVPPAVATSKPSTTTVEVVTESSAPAVPPAVAREASPVVPPPVAATPPPQPRAGAHEDAHSADDLYEQGMERLRARQLFEARDSFTAAVAADPGHARAHLRLGEMALFGRDADEARAHLDAALQNRDRLDARELKLTELGLAVLDRDRFRARALIRELEAISPNDPDLRRFRDLEREDRPKPFRRRPR
jgi:serine/threonine protein kinase